MRLGEYQELVCVKNVDFGIYLSTSSDSEERVLLPAKQIPDGVRPGDKLEVFVYKDSNDRLIATTNKPKLTLGGLSVLTVKEVTKIGAFLDWGLEKDLFLPYNEWHELWNTSASVRGILLENITNEDIMKCIWLSERIEQEAKPLLRYAEYTSYILVFYKITDSKIWYRWFLDKEYNSLSDGRDMFISLIYSMSSPHLPSTLSVKFLRLSKISPINISRPSLSELYSLSKNQRYHIFESVIL